MFIQQFITGGTDIEPLWFSSRSCPHPHPSACKQKGILFSERALPMIWQWRFRQTAMTWVQWTHSMDRWQKLPCSYGSLWGWWLLFWLPLDTHYRGIKRRACFPFLCLDSKQWSIHEWQKKKKIPASLLLLHGSTNTEAVHQLSCM